MQRHDALLSVVVPEGGAKRESKEALMQTDSQEHSSELSTEKHSSKLGAKNYRKEGRNGRAKRP